MESILLSIIIPAYNVAIYLRECLDSLKNFFEYDNVEVLLVNDGSTDETLTIAKEYQIMYGRRFVIIDQENGGYGSVLNQGIKNARGKYFRILDSDDWINTNVISDYINGLENCNSDMILTAYETVNISSGKKIKYEIDARIKSKGSGNFLEVCLYQFITMHMMTVKTEILRKNNISIDEKTFYTDLEFAIFPLKYIKTFTAIDIYLYQYRIGVPGQSVSLEGRYKNRLDHMKVISRLIEVLSGLDEGSNLYKYIKEKLFDLITVHYRMYGSFQQGGNELKNELWQFDSKIQCVKKEWLEVTDNIFAKMLVRSNYRMIKLEQMLYRIMKCWKRIQEKKS